MQLDEAGGVPMLRGALEAFRAIASVAAWERAREPSEPRVARAGGMAGAGGGPHAVGP